MALCKHILICQNSSTRYARCAYSTTWLIGTYMAQWAVWTRWPIGSIATHRSQAPTTSTSPTQAQTVPAKCSGRASWKPTNYTKFRSNNTHSHSVLFLAVYSLWSWTATSLGKIHIVNVYFCAHFLAVFLLAVCLHLAVGLGRKIHNVSVYLTSIIHQKTNGICATYER